MKLYNGIHIPYFLRITNTTFEDLEHSGRKDEEWGSIRRLHPEDNQYHPQKDEERENE